MALTLAEAAKLSNDVLLTGVVETIIKDSPVLQRLPFIEIAGNGLTYNRENAAPTVSFFDVGDTWTESTPTFTQQTVTLKIMGGDADIDTIGEVVANPVYEAVVAALVLWWLVRLKRRLDAYISAHNHQRAGDRLAALVYHF